MDVQLEVLTTTHLTNKEPFTNTCLRAWCKWQILLKCFCSSPPPSPSDLKKFQGILAMKTIGQPHRKSFKIRSIFARKFVIFLQGPLWGKKFKVPHFTSNKYLWLVPINTLSVFMAIWELFLPIMYFTWAGMLILLTRYYNIYDLLLQNVPLDPCYKLLVLYKFNWGIQ